MPNALVDITLSEVSGVDKPAQEPAVVNLIKNRDGRKPSTTTTKSSTGETPMTKEQAELLEKLEAISKMTGVQKSHYDALDTDEAKEEFLAKSAEDKDAEVEANKSDDDTGSDNSEEVNKDEGDDTVVYKSRTGIVARKKDGEALVEALKSADESAEKLEKMELEKRAATEFANFSKDASTNEALCKALDTLPTKDRTAVVKALSSHVKVSEVAQTTVSKNDGSSANDTADFDEKMEELRKTYANRPDITDIDLRKMAYDALAK